MNFAAHFKNRAQIRWGIIGCGDVTEVKSGPGFQKADGSALVAVMRRNGALAADYARRHGVPRWYDNADALIADAEVDAVYIATPPDTHCEYALRVAAAGKPAYVEKPMARHAPECDRMVDAFQRAQLPLFVAYYRRRLPRFLTARDLIADGSLGEITGVRYHCTAPRHRDDGGWRVNAAQSGGGHFLDIGSHALDLLDFFFGPLTEVAGVAANHGGKSAVEDQVAMSFRTGSMSEGNVGNVSDISHETTLKTLPLPSPLPHSEWRRGSRSIPGVASWNFASAEREDAFTITGTDGRLTFSLMADEPLRLENAAGVQTLSRPNPPHVAQPLIQSVVDDLLARSACPSTGESARRASQVMDIVLASFYGGRQDEFWQRAETWPGPGRGATFDGSRGFQPVSTHGEVIEGICVAEQRLIRDGPFSLTTDLSSGKIQASLRDASALGNRKPWA